MVDAIIENDDGRVNSDSWLGSTRSLDGRERTILQLKTQLRKSREEAQVLATANSNLQAQLTTCRTENEQLREQLADVLQQKDEFERLMGLIQERIKAFTFEREIAFGEGSTKIETSINLSRPAQPPVEKSIRRRDSLSKQEIDRLQKQILEVQQRNANHLAQLKQFDTNCTQSKLAQLQRLRNQQIQRTQLALRRVASIVLPK